MAAIFISHSNRDGQPAERMKNWLAAQGYERVFIDFDKHTGIDVGEQWERRLYDEIARCHAIILILTPNWMDSKWCFVEFTQARALGKLIFPIVFSPLGDKRVAPEIQGLNLSDWDAAGQEYLQRRIREISDEVARGFRWDGSRPPYPGIYSFDAEDAAIFFGRDTEIREVIERLEARRVSGGTPLLLLLGASGSGKSSLLKAGVLPQLARDKAHWILLPTFRPERAPLAAFAKSVAESLDQPKSWGDWLQRFVSADAPAALKALADELRLREAREATILIPIDQFEETVTATNTAERMRFFDLLRTATNPDQGLPYLVVGTIRSDVLGELLQSQQIRLPFTDYALRPVPLDRISKLIEGPAEVAALTLEKGLSGRIADDVKAPDALPLLAFALRELYERFGKDRRLTISDYEKLGNQEVGLSPIENAIRRKADDVLNALQPSSAKLDALKEALIPHLVRVRDDGAFARQVAKLSDLPQAAGPLINAFVDARLMSTRVESDDDNKQTVRIEVAHEALFKAWPLLAKWLAGERQFLVGKAQLDRFLADWSAAHGPQKRNALLQGLYLARAREWLQTHRNSLSKHEITFIEASARRARQRKSALWGLGLATIVLIGAIVTPKVYDVYVRRTALDCDLYAAEQDNNVHVPGVEFDRIIPDLAIPACASAAELDATNPRLLHNLARSYDKAGKFEAAAAWYQKAVDLGWPPSENNLAVLYFYGRGVSLDFSKGVMLLRAAVEQNNEDAIRNYSRTDFTTLFDGNDGLASILERALFAKGFLTSVNIQKRWSLQLVNAINAFKNTERLTDAGVTIRVLDRLGVVNEISRATDRKVEMRP
jgi:tetratricopeptide (TPR) repeat protein